MPHLEDDRVKTETQRDLLCSVHRVNDNFWVIWPFIGLIYPSEPLDLASPVNEIIHFESFTAEEKHSWKKCFCLRFFEAQLS